MPRQGLLASIEQIEKDDSEGSTGQYALKRNPAPILFQGDGIGEFGQGADFGVPGNSPSSHRSAFTRQTYRVVRMRIGVFSFFRSVSWLVQPRASRSALR